MPKALNNVFSNGLPSARVATMARRLQAACPGLLLVDTRDSVSVHLKHQASGKFYALSMMVQEGRWAAADTAAPRIG